MRFLKKPPRQRVPDFEGPTKGLTKEEVEELRYWLLKWDEARQRINSMPWPGFVEKLLPFSEEQYFPAYRDDLLLHVLKRQLLENPK